MAISFKQLNRNVARFAKNRDIHQLITAYIHCPHPVYYGLLTDSLKEHGFISSSTTDTRLAQWILAAYVAPLNPEVVSVFCTNEYGRTTDTMLLNCIDPNPEVVVSLRRSLNYGPTSLPYRQIRMRHISEQAANALSDYSDPSGAFCYTPREFWKTHILLRCEEVLAWYEQIFHERNQTH